MGILLLGFLMLSPDTQWMSLCKEIRVEIEESVRRGEFKESDMRGILRRCERWEERRSDK